MPFLGKVAILATLVIIVHAAISTAQCESGSATDDGRTATVVRRRQIEGEGGVRPRCSLFHPMGRELCSWTDG
jgi:hypothetical protein